MITTIILMLQQGATLAPEAPLSLPSSSASEKTVQIGGRLQSDWTFILGGEDTEAALGSSLSDGFEIRRARLGVFGDLASELSYKLEMDFAGDKNAFTDAYLEYSGSSWGDWKVGHFKEPFSIEELTSSRFISFMERSSASSALAPGRNAGVMLSDSNDSITWAGGAFRETDDFAKTSDQAWSGTGRFVYRPWFEDKGRSFAHIGVAASMRSTNDSYKAKIRPESRLGVDYFATPTLAADSVMLLGIEAAAQEGPFHGQFEWITAEVSDDGGGAEPGLSGFSIQGGWFLTGESRGYKTSSAAWDRVKPLSDALDGGGTGAWEVALRYSSVDMQEAGAGADFSAISVALNWYLNDYTRVMLDVVRPELGAADDVTVIALRAAFDF
ncbi:MAG: porin [Planctomycetota bacterium]|nr:porin [Planctomycetota bacterium]